MKDNMKQLLDKAFEIASQQTQEWADEMLAVGIYVSEYQMDAKFTAFYEEAVMNTKIDVLNF